MQGKTKNHPGAKFDTGRDVAVYALPRLALAWLAQFTKKQLCLPVLVFLPHCETIAAAWRLRIALLIGGEDCALTTFLG